MEKKIMCVVYNFKKEKLASFTSKQEAEAKIFELKKADPMGMYFWNLEE